MHTKETPRSGLLSVVLPAYNEEASVPLAARTVHTILVQADIPHELIFVNDGSKDGTWKAIQDQAAQIPQVRGIRFSRNFGKESAIFAGLAQASGDCCVVMDCDLQHPPEKVVEMYRLWQQGYQVVEGVKVSRGQGEPPCTPWPPAPFITSSARPPRSTCPGPPTLAPGPPGGGRAGGHAGEKRLLPGPVLLDRV